MMTLAKFYDMIDRNAKVTLKDGKTGTALYTGSAKAIPDRYDNAIVADFQMNDAGRLTFKLRLREKQARDPHWKEGTIKVGGSYYHYWAKVYEGSSQYGIDGGQISKLMIKRNDEIVANYDRGWDVEPVDEDTEAALAIIQHEYDE